MNNIKKMMISAVAFLLMYGVSVAEEKTDKDKIGKAKERQLCMKKIREAGLPFKVEISELKMRIKLLKKKSLKSNEQYLAMMDEFMALKTSKEAETKKLEEMRELKRQLKELKRVQKDTPEVADLKNRLKQLKDGMKEAFEEVECGEMSVK